jgi:hypothetical protein
VRLSLLVAPRGRSLSGPLYYPSRRQPTPAFALLVDTLRCEAYADELEGQVAALQGERESKNRQRFQSKLPMRPRANRSSILN